APETAEAECSLVAARPAPTMRLYGAHLRASAARPTGRGLRTRVHDHDPKTGGPRVWPGSDTWRRKRTAKNAARAWGGAKDRRAAPSAGFVAGSQRMVHGCAERGRTTSACARRR